MRARHLGRLLAVAGAAVVLAGCGATVQGKAVSIFEDPFKVAGLQAVDGNSGLRPDAEKPTREVTDGDGGKDDEIAVQSVSDLETFWQDAYGQTFDGQFEPVKDLISWDSNGYDGTFCDESTDGLVNAAFCEDDNTVGWDRGVLLPSLRQANGDMAITMVLAH
jgi:predicted metalloprotease